MPSLASIAALACLTSAAAQDAGVRPPLGTLFDVGGRRTHIHCVGTGSPTVILEAGGLLLLMAVIERPRERKGPSRNGAITD